MKLTSEGLVTSTELMEELFGMNKKLIHNLSEKKTYEKIYEYLISEQGAEELETKRDSYNNHTILECKGEVYLIPEDIFDELDEEWLEVVDTEEETEITPEPAQVVSV